MSESPVALVTGAAQGLGAAICEVLLSNGYKVCASDIQEKKGRQFEAEQQKKFGNDNFKFVICDVTKEEDFERAFEYVLKEFKRIDLLVNNAGSVCEQNPKKIIDLNLVGTITGCQMALKYMSKSNGFKGGMVINIASMLGLAPYPGTPVYTATKHAIVGLTRCYGDPFHFDKHGVSFAALCPSIIDTDFKILVFTNTLIPNNEPYKDNPKMMSPEFVAQGALKLLEDRINGSILAVTKDAGYVYIGLQEEVKKIIDF